MEKIKEFIQNHLVDIVISASVIFFVFGIWLLYTASRTANDYHHVNDTVQSAERDNQQARQQIDSATAEIDSAQKRLDRSVKSVDRITERTQQVKRRIDSNSKIIGEGQDIVDAGRRDTEEARSIFADVDKRNKITGTQADSHA